LGATEVGVTNKLGTGLAPPLSQAAGLLDMGFSENIRLFKVCLLGFVFCLFIFFFLLELSFCFRPQSGENDDGTRKRTWLLTKLNSCFLSMERKAAKNRRDPEIPQLVTRQAESDSIKRLEFCCARFEPVFARVETCFRKLGPKKPPKPKETTFQLVRRQSLQRMDSIATLVNEKLSESAVMKAEQVKMKEQLSRFQSLVQSHEARIASQETRLETLEREVQGQQTPQELTNEVLPFDESESKATDFIVGDRVEVMDDEDDEDWEAGTVAGFDDYGSPLVLKDGFSKAFVWYKVRYIQKDVGDSRTFLVEDEMTEFDMGDV